MCGLSAGQVAFLRAAFLANGPALSATDAEATQTLREELTVLLSGPAPAVAFNGLLLPSAWNAGMEMLWPGTLAALADGRHPLRHLAVLHRTGRLDGETFRQATRFFWLTTAPWSSAGQYDRLVESLSRSPIFRREWLALAHPRPGAIIDILNVGIDFRAAGGRYRSHLRAIIDEPRHLVIEFLPLDGAARELFERARSKPPEVIFHPLHGLTIVAAGRAR